MELNERQKKAIDYVKRHDRITKAEYAVINKTSDATAKRDLKELTAKKIFNILGTGTAIHYVMSRHEPIRYTCYARGHDTFTDKRKHR